MQTIIRLVLSTLLLVNLCENAIAQKKKRKKKFSPVISRAAFIWNRELSDSFFMHYFAPNKTITAYTNEGQKITLSKIDTFPLTSIDSGTINGITGNWALDEKNINLVYYIPFDSNLTDVTDIVRVAARKEYYGQVDERLLLLGVLILPFCFIGLYVWRAAPERVAFPWKKM